MNVCVKPRNGNKPEQGVFLLRKFGAIEKALTGLDPIWEADLISECYTEFAHNRKLPAAEELFALNRGALRQEGIALPVQISVYGESADSSKTQKLLMSALSKAGFKSNDSSRFILNIRINGSAAAGYTAHCELIDSEGKIKTLRYSNPIRSLNKEGIYNFARLLANDVFKVE